MAKKTADRTLTLLIATKQPEIGGAEALAEMRRHLKCLVTDMRCHSHAGPLNDATLASCGRGGASTHPGGLETTGGPDANAGEGPKRRQFCMNEVRDEASGPHHHHVAMSYSDGWLEVDHDQDDPAVVDGETVKTDAQIARACPVRSPS